MKPGAPTLLSETKVTRRWLELVLKVGGATLPQNLGAEQGVTLLALEMLPPAHCTTTLPSCDGFYLVRAPRAGAGSMPPAPCSS